MSMLVSSPSGQDPKSKPSFVELVVRELGKMLEQGRISHALYSQAVDRARVQSKVINNIYARKAITPLQVCFLILHQLHKFNIYKSINR